MKNLERVLVEDIHENQSLQRRRVHQMLPVTRVIRNVRVSPNVPLTGTAIYLKITLINFLFFSSPDRFTPSGFIHKKYLDPKKRGSYLDATVLVPAWWPVLLEAFLAVNGTTFSWLEWYFTFLSAVTTNGLVHFAWTTVVVAPLSITHNFHSYYVVDNLNRDSRYLHG